MAGSDPRFPTQKFKDAIRFAMKMGKPDDPANQVVFIWKPVKTYAKVDPAGRPYSFSATPSSTVAGNQMTVPVALEFTARPAGTRDTTIGQFDTSRVVLTLLREDYDLVKTSDYVVIDGNAYDIDLDAPQLNLFDVGVVSLICEARDESR